MGTSTRAQVQGTLLLFAAAIAGTACPPRPAPTRAASFDTSGVDTVSVARMRAYGTTLDYDGVLGAADSQPLLVRQGRRVGFAKIEPEKGAYRLDTSDLARGRVIARITSESAYAHLGLGPGTNWWWVDKRGGKWRSIIYSESRNERSVQILDSLWSHPGYVWRQSTARFMLSDTLVAMWGNCGRCCPKY
jgi:hypothetical protein